MYQPSTKQHSVLLLLFVCSSILIPWARSTSSTVCNSITEFKCHNSGECIPKYDVCNNFANCADKSDEEFCLLGGRSASLGGELGVVHIIAEFRNAFRTFVRDIMKEVSDLLRLKTSLATSGGETVECKIDDAFLCKVDNICIPLSARCDTKHDCSNGEDERPSLCSVVDGSSLRRSLNKKLIHIEDRVEKLVPLPDIVSLEKSRRVLPFLPRSLRRTTTNLSPTTEETVKVICNSKQFACDKTCIPLSWVCDDLEDCIDKTDETQEQCSKSKST